MAWERPSHLIVDQQAPPMGIHDDVACTDVAVQDRRELVIMVSATSQITWMMEAGQD